MNILITFLDEKEPIYIDKDSYKSGNLLKLISNGIIVPNTNKQIKFDKLLVIYSNKYQKGNFRQLRDCLTNLKKNGISIKLMLEESNNFDIDLDTNSLSYYYELISKIIKSIRLKYPNDQMYLNLTCGYSKVKLATSLYLYNISKENKSYLHCVDLLSQDNFNFYEYSLDSKANLEQVDIQGIIDQDSSKLMYNYICLNNFSSTNMILDKANAIVPKEFKNGVKFAYYATLRINYEQANKILLEDNKLYSRLKNLEIFDYFITQKDYGICNLNDLIFYLLMLDKYLLEEQYEEFALYSSPCLFNLILICLEKEKQEFKSLETRKVYYQDYQEYLFQIKRRDGTCLKWKVDEEKLKDLNYKNKINGNETSIVNYSTQSFASVSVLTNLRENLNFRNNCARTKIVTDNSKYIQEFSNYEKEFRDISKHNSFLREDKSNILEDETKKIFNLVLECMNYNLNTSFKKENFDIFYKIIDEYLLEML